MKKSLILIILSVFEYSFAVGVESSGFVINEESLSQGARVSSKYVSCNSIVSSNCLDKFNSNFEHSNAIKLGEHNTILPAQIHDGSSSNYVDSNSYKFDQNAVNNFNITNSNQTAMQSYATVINANGNNVVSPSEMIMNRLAVPIKTGDNSSIKVTPEKVEFNLKY
ncbi:MAG: hypothetical protein PHC75_07925 [Burkholderiales bacterium]|nr:hypothetical protein [Burkholderiales bacterium]